MMFITKKRLIKEAVRLYNDNENHSPCKEKTFYYNMGNANALTSLCARLGIDLVQEVKKDREIGGQ